MRPASTKTGPSPATGAPSPSSSIEPPAVGKPSGRSEHCARQCSAHGTSVAPAKVQYSSFFGPVDVDTSARVTRPRPRRPSLHPAPVAAPKTNAPSGYVQIQTSSGPAYFQQTPSGLAIVSDPTTLSKLKNGALPSTVKPYSPSLTFATSPASSAPSNPSTVPFFDPVDIDSSREQSDPTHTAWRCTSSDCHGKYQRVHGLRYKSKQPTGPHISSRPRRD